MKYLKLLLFLSTLILFTACSDESGDSSGGDSGSENNKIPVASAGSDGTVQVNTGIVITGSGKDSDGIIISYEWKKGSIILATTASFKYTPTVVGTDTLTLTVTDNDGAKASDNIKIKVTDVLTHKANLRVIYKSNNQKSYLTWNENSYKDSIGYRVEKRMSGLSRAVDDSWTEISTLNAGGGTYAIQDATSVPTEYRVVALDDNILLSGENNAHELLVNPSHSASIYFTQNDTNISMPLNRTVVANTTLDPNTVASRVIYYIDTIKIGQSDTAPNFPLSFNSGHYTNGNHRLDYEVKIEDANYVSFKSMIITQNTNLALSLRLGRQTGIIPVIAQATSKETVNGVKFYLNDTLVADIKDKNYCGSRYGCGSQDANDSYMWEWNSTNYTPMEYTLRADTSDTGGESLSKEIVHQLNNPPALNVVLPIADSIVGDTLAISGTVSDDQGNCDISIKIGNITIYSSTGTSFYTSYDMTGLSEKSYTIEIKATDKNNKATIIRKNVIYHSGSNFTIWKTLGKDTTLLKINNGYLVSKKKMELDRLNIATNINQRYSLDIVRDQRINYLDVQNTGKIVFGGNLEKRVDIIFKADDNLSVLAGMGWDSGYHPILNNKYSLWISSYTHKMALYNFVGENIEEIDKPKDTKYWLNWSYYLSSKYFCSSIKLSSKNSDYDLFIYDIDAKQLKQVTYTSDTVEMCKGIDDTRVIFGEYNSSPNKLYYSELNNLSTKVEISSNFSDAKLVDGVMAWTNKDDKTLYMLNKNNTTPIKIATNAYLQEVKDGVITYIKDGKLYLYKDGFSKEIWMARDKHYIDNGYIYIIRGTENLIYRLMI